MSKKADFSKLGGLVAPKGVTVEPAADSVQRGSKEAKDETKGSKDDIVNLSFKVSNQFRKRFKLAAVNAGITQNELVMQALQAWEKH